jgi:hypothetical protein
MSESKQNIAFSLSESSFALYPPLEQHDGDFPAISQPMLAALPSKEEDVPQQSLTVPVGEPPAEDDAYPVDEGLYSPMRAASMTATRLGLRGDSFPGGVNLLSENPDAKLSQLMLAAALSYPPPPHKYGPIVIVSSYSCFSDLAHGPRGTEARRAMRTYRLNVTDGSLMLLSLTPESMLHNPAFTRRHPALNVVYACTESVKKEGQVFTLMLDGRTGALSEHCPAVGAGGTSTCYLTIHHKARRMLLVNYWDSTICTLELMPDGKVGTLLVRHRHPNALEPALSCPLPCHGGLSHAAGSECCHGI